MMRKQAYDKRKHEKELKLGLCNLKNNAGYMITLDK